MEAKPNNFDNLIGGLNFAGRLPLSGNIYED